MKLPKLKTEGIGQIILAIWIIFSIVFVANSIWNNYKINVKDEATKQGASIGYQQAVMDLIKQAETCQAFPVNVGEESIELKKVGCIDSE
jgi:hypothetical protein